MVRRGRDQAAERGTTPPGEMLQTTPPVYPGADYSFVLQSVFEIQKAIGGLEQATTNLTDELRNQRKTLNWISRVIWFTTGGVVIAGVLVSFIIDRGFDRLLQVLVKSGSL